MRRNEGRETIIELRNWGRGQAASERLAGKILALEGFDNIDPSHPLGGPDGGKDFLCSFNGKRWVGACYFPNGEKTFADIKTKFIKDIKGVKKNNAIGMAFVTNQEISVSNREILKNIDRTIDIRIYHLERIANILDTPKMYGVRLEFLDIEMTKEEQLSYFNATQEGQYTQLLSKMDELKNMFSTIPQTDDDEPCIETRRMTEIQEAENMFFEKVWLDRHFSLKYRVEELGEIVSPEIWKTAEEAADRLIKKYGDNNIGPYSDFEWGMINGKLSALRWVLGDEWDMLDT